MKHHINTENTVSLPGISALSHLLYVLLYLYFPSFSNIIFSIPLINKSVAEVYFPPLQNLLTREFNLFGIYYDYLSVWVLSAFYSLRVSRGGRWDVQSAFVMLIELYSLCYGLALES